MTSKSQQGRTSPTNFHHHHQDECFLQQPSIAEGPLAYHWARMSLSLLAEQRGDTGEASPHQPARIRHLERKWESQSIPSWSEISRGLSPVTGC